MMRVLGLLLVLVTVGCISLDEEFPVVDTREVSPPTPEVVVSGEVEEQAPSFDMSLHSLEEPGSLWVVVNKRRALDPHDYAPGDLVAPNIPSAFPPLLRQEVARAAEEMYAEAWGDGVPFRLQSTYRSFAIQQRVKAASVERFGQEVSDQRSARAGHSEHQTGLALDISGAGGSCALEACFATTPEGVWLAKHAWRFGFILRYPEGKSDTTGYIFEPWHFRYVGLGLAQELNEQGNPTLEEFFGLGAAPEYLSEGR
jgi:D-alanyl-D-alanine carboxypeptidase